MKIRRRAHVTLTRIAVAVSVLSLLLVGSPLVVSSQPAEAAPNTSVCAPNTAFGVLENGQLRKINVETGESSDYGSANLHAQFPLEDYNLGYDVSFADKRQVNGLAVTPDGNNFYAFRGWSQGWWENDGTPDRWWNAGIRNYFDLYKYDANGENPERVDVTPDGTHYFPFGQVPDDEQNMDLIAGAINPADGRYYFGGYHQEENSTGGYNLYFVLRSIDPKDGRLRHIAKIYVGQQDHEFSLIAANGDIVFDRDGNFHLLSANNPLNGFSLMKIVTLPASDLPTNNDGEPPYRFGSQTEPRKVDASDGVANSFAVNSDGALIIATTQSAFKIDPTSFEQQSTANNINGGSGLINTDLASCHFPPALEVKKNVVDRLDPSDQFQLTADDQTDQGVFANVTTDGEAKGEQPKQIGPAVVTGGNEYIINEQMAAKSASQMSEYSSTLECKASYQNGDVESLTPTKVDGQKYKVKIPETGTRGAASVSCMYTNTPKDSAFAVKKESAEAGATAADGAWTSAYTVTVSNTGEATGTSQAVTDTPAVPAGFTTTKATIDGKDVELTDGAFTVTDGVKLAPGETKTFDIVLSGTYDNTADWAAAGECNVEGDGDSSKGFFNKVTMEGDTDGTENNDACNSVTKDPAFAVKKDAAGAELGDGDTFTSKYSVTVTNTGEVTGTSKAVTDKPEFAPGFNAKTATVNGQSVDFTDGTFTITDGVKLNPKETKTFDIVITGSYTADADWTKASECNVDGGLKPGNGLFNSVDMTGDTDGTENNNACNPLDKPESPKFAVQKDKVSGAATIGEDGTWSADYMVTVRNVGNVDGTSAKVTDTPSAPAGFKITGATVEGNDVSSTDSFTITDGVKLKAGESKSFTVTVKGTFDEATANWSDAGECEPQGTGSSKKGFFNKVTMEDDTDGTENNDACVPGFEPSKPSLSIIKKLNGHDAPANAPVTVAPGDPVHATFLVENTGNTVINDIKVTDSVIDTSDIKAPATKYSADGKSAGTYDGSLKPGEYAVYTATIKALGEGTTHKNVGKVTGIPEIPGEPGEPGKPGEPLEDEDDGNAESPKLTIVKKINGEEAPEEPGVEVEAGSKMAITYVVKNDGKVALNNVKVSDRITVENGKNVDVTVPADDINCPTTSLAPGEEMECSASMPAPEPGTRHQNKAKAQGTPPPNAPEAPGRPGEPEFPNDVPPLETPEVPANAHTPKEPETPTSTPTETPEPTEEPTQPAPSEEPTEPAPSEEPTQPAPSEEPTEPAPSEEPTQPAPSEEPTEPAPSEEPTQPAPPEESPEPRPNPLPRTGVEAGALIATAMTLMGAGVASIVASRRRRK